MTMAEPIETTSTSATPEPVVAAPVPVPVVAAERNAAIEAAAEAALMMPGVPGKEEFLTLAMTAKMLSLSGAAPEAVRNNPYVAFHVAMVGRDLGISPSAAINLIDVIASHGQYQLSLSPQLLNGQIRRLGLGEVLKKTSTLGVCVAVAVGPGGIDNRCRLTWRNDIHAEGCRCDILGESEFTWEDAQMAGLVGRHCQPGDHKAQGDKGCGCNQGYKTYPKRMLWWRAGGFAADDYFPEAGLGLYSPEELGAVVDDDGRPIDPSKVALPDGYELPKAAQAAAAATKLAPEDERWNIRLRIMALPDDVGAELRESWKKSDKVGPVDQLTVAGMRVAQAMVSGAESKARTKHKDWSTTSAMEAIARQVVAALLPPWAGRSDSAPTPPDPPKSGAPAPEVTEDTSKTETGRKSAPTGPASPADGERGHAAAEPTDEDLEGASPRLINDTIAEVLAMKAHDVDKALTAYKLHTEGELDSRKRRLTLAIVRERKQSQA